MIEEIEDPHHLEEVEVEGNNYNSFNNLIRYNRSRSRDRRDNRGYRGGDRRGDRFGGDRRDNRGYRGGDRRGDRFGGRDRRGGDRRGGDRFGGGGYRK